MKIGESDSAHELVRMPHTSSKFYLIYVFIYYFDDLHLQIIESISPKASVENSSVQWAIFLNQTNTFDYTHMQCFLEEKQVVMISIYKYKNRNKKTFWSLYLVLYKKKTFSWTMHECINNSL